MDLETIRKRLEQKQHELTVAELVSISHETAKLKGWWDNMDRNLPEQLALMHSELSEALEAYRDGDMAQRFIEGSKPEGFGVELADVLIRIADTCGRYGIDLNECLRVKLLYNTTRSRRHGGKTC